MSVEQPRAKARPYDDHCRQRLRDGPDACRLASVGYRAPVRATSVADPPPDGHPAVLAALRADWARDGRTLTDRWDAGERGVCVWPWTWVPRQGPEVACRADVTLGPVATEGSRT